MLIDKSACWIGKPVMKTNKDTYNTKFLARFFGKKYFQNLMPYVWRKVQEVWKNRFCKSKDKHARPLDLRISIIAVVPVFNGSYSVLLV